MKFHLDSKTFKAERAWSALDIGLVEGASARLHWTDTPYVWHVNNGAEVFCVLDGMVDMHYREAGAEKVQHLVAGDISFAEAGDGHVAHPLGEARILMIEKQGSL